MGDITAIIMMALSYLRHRHTITSDTVRRFRSHAVSRRQSYGGQLLSWYSKKLDTHPLTTKMISAGIVASCGDVLSQKVRAHRAKQAFSWDMIRTAKFGFLGFIYIAPLTHVWYGWLLKQSPGTSLKSVAIRVGIDQFCFEPIYVPSFLTAVWVFEGEGWDDVKDLLWETAPPTLVANWILWIPATAIIFKYVPAKFQVLAANMVGFLWGAYVSYTAHEAEDEHDHEKLEHEHDDHVTLKGESSTTMKIQESVT